MALISFVLLIRKEEEEETISSICASVSSTGWAEHNDSHYKYFSSKKNFRLIHLVILITERVGAYILYKHNSVYVRYSE